MSNLLKGWSEKKLGEIVEIVNGGTPSTSNTDFWGDDIPWITPKDLSGFDRRYISRGEKNITSQGLENSSAKLLPENTILFSSRAPIGYVAIAKNELTTNQGFKNIVCDEIKTHYLFMYYWLCNNANRIEKLSSGSTFSEASTSLMKSLNIELPVDLNEQKAIANILSSLDNKIELLKEQNKTLETIAQTIFKEWFVNFNYPDATGEMVESEMGEIPKGWRVGTIGDIANLKSGYAFKSEDFVDSSYCKVLKIKDLKGNGKVDLSNIDSINIDLVDNYRVRYFKLSEADIVLAMSGNTTGKIGIVPKSNDQIYLNQRVGKFFLKDEIYKNFLYIYLMLNNYESKILSMGYGSAQPNINPSQIENIKLILPSEDVLTTFGLVINPMFKRILNSISKIQTLETIRDSLLPRLMSGKLRVDEYDA